MTNNPFLPQQQGNRLLACLPEEEYRSLLPLLRPVSLTFEQPLYEARGPIDFAYFLTTAVASALVIMEDGRAIEAATIGNEGLVGHTVVFGVEVSLNRVIVQVAGDALRIEAGALREKTAREGPLRKLLAEYSQRFLLQVSQSVACNGLHPVEQRCCRWLLMTHDRVGCDELRLTHEFLGMMLGVRRATVSEVLAPLQDAGLLRSHRGLITLLDRPGLEMRSCECYHVVKQEYDRLLGVKGEPARQR